MNSKRKELLKSPGWRQAIRLIRSVAAITLGSICLLAITDVGRTHTRTISKLRAKNHAIPLFKDVSGEAKSPSNLVGQMPPSFDKDGARVVADIDRIEGETLRQLDRTSLDREGQVRTLGKL